MRLFPLSLLLAVCPAFSNLAVAQDTARDRLIHLRFAEFDPAAGQLQIPNTLRGGKDTQLWIVQFEGSPTETNRKALREVGAEIHGYLPENAYVARMPHKVMPLAQKLAGVRSVSYYHPAFRLDPDLIREIAKGDPQDVRRFNIVVVNKHKDKPALMTSIQKLGGKIVHEQIGSLLLEANLNQKQLIQAARLDQVLWIDLWTESEEDMNNARIQGGANYVEKQGKYTGKGINGHVYEGVEAGHKDFTNKAINVSSSGAAQSHGHCTAGIVFGNGKSHTNARGMAPDAQPFYTTYTSVQGSRWKVVETLVKKHKVMFTTASWGNARTTQYTSVSADTDDIIFDHDMPWTQSQSNSGGTPSRPQAWAKNIFSVGGVVHRDNSNPLDDSWKAGRGSTGPAADGRIKPDLCAYYDRIFCSDRTGSAGYNRLGDYYTSFGGTSGATPIVAGHNAIAIQMFTDGLFSPKRVINGTRWQNKPHFTTLKALQIANASQYAFTSTSTDNRREHVGWGMPNLKTMYDNRKVHFVVDETDILTHGKGIIYTVRVARGQSELKVSMCYADLAANPSASITRVNDLTLRVTAPNGSTKYWGNAGLKTGNYSTTNGQRDSRNTVENVFVKNPAAGLWKIEVGAFLIAKDSHVETKAVDADFGLVVNGAVFVNKKSMELTVGAFTTFGQGCPSASGCAPCVSRNWTKTITSKTSTAQQIALMDWSSEAIKICGIDLFTQARSGSVDVTVRLMDMGSSSLPGKVLATAKVKVGTKLQTYTVKFAQPVSLSASTVFWVVFDKADKLILSESKTGSASYHLEMRKSVWSSTYWNNTKWQYRIHCDKGNQTPILGLTGSPLIGQTMKLELSKARGATPGMLILGGSNKAWSTLPLPFAYAAPCNLLVSVDIVVAFVTNGSGLASVPIPIPNDKRLIGVVAFEQFVVADTRNALGVISSNGCRTKLGEF